MKISLPPGKLKVLHIDLACGKADGSNAAIIKVGSESHRGTVVKFEGPCELVFQPNEPRFKYQLQTNGAVEIEKL